MRKIYPFLFFSFFLAEANAQTENVLPRYLTDDERTQMETYQRPAPRGVESPPPFTDLRTMAEWEEIQALTISWTSYPGILKQIVRAAKEECRVIIFCENCISAENYLLGSQAGGALENLDNIELVPAEYNSIWMRDYGANTVYADRVDSLILVDWIYNRPRPDDDVIPGVLADYLSLDVYSTTSAPSDLVNTGGNFMSDGQGTAWASELILEENEAGNPYNVTVKDEVEIDAILADFQGISRYIKMTALQYDIINHIDMHMKLLDEQTLLVGEYPPNTADGPQINANIDYVVNTFLSHFDLDYKVVRIPMPDSQSGLYPDDNPAGYYRTYTNGVFVNKTFIYPSYREEYDTTAARIYGHLLPGYTLVPIDCDNAGENIIAAAGAIHCITHSVGVSDPLLIVHQPLEDTYDTESRAITAEMEHRSGLASAKIYWRTQGDLAFEEAELDLSNSNAFTTGVIPGYPVGTIVEYYLAGEAESGKSQVRPIVAPAGFWSYEVLGETVGIADIAGLQLNPIYPNPATNLVSIPIVSRLSKLVNVYVTDLTGRELKSAYSGTVSGDQRLSLIVDDLPAGAYLVVVESGQATMTQPLVISR